MESGAGTRAGLRADGGGGARVPSLADSGLDDTTRVRTIVRRSGPRLVRDAFGPLVVFVAGWKLIGLVPGIIAAAVFGLLVYAHERRSGRPARVVLLALLLVAIRATVGLSSQDSTLYLAQEVVIDTVLGSVVLISMRTTRPFASWFATEIFPFPEEIQRSAEYVRVMRRITLVWGCYFLARGAIRLLALLTLSTNWYLVVAAGVDAPFLIALLAWSAYYLEGVLGRNHEWVAMVTAAGRG
jgi:uncharacterized membrane protein